ncbi:hypothetical protein L6452_33724 [Arctium lappa]|uniref:Uncharacterized protein n=1 Tax=Arctium lappa TaxID=4217 RepID=A0ACB8YG85_ARCLA|nr:hypothetical protein L6452_33724 [Arctium lappa]
MRFCITDHAIAASSGFICSWEFGDEGNGWRTQKWQLQVCGVYKQHFGEDINRPTVIIHISNSIQSDLRKRSFQRILLGFQKGICYSVDLNFTPVIQII